MELLFAPAAAKALSPSLTQHAASLLDGLLRAHLAAASAVTAAMSEVPMLWLPLIVCLGLGLAGSAYRIASAAVRFPGLGSLVGRLWLARRVLCILRSLVRKLFPRRAFVQAAPRRTSSSPRVDYGAVAALPTAFASGDVPGAVSVPSFEAFKDLVSSLPARPPSNEWKPMLENSTSMMTYKAWRHGLPTGNAEYLSVTVFEGTTPQELHAFFNDDAHRMSWDPMLVGFEVLEQDTRTGAEVVRWVRRFPLMCTPRDYVFSRRSWADGADLYTVTRACAYPGCPPRPRCRRVDAFYSSWRMRAVPGRNGGVACEVTFQHYEEMGVQADLAKLAIRRGMWGCVLNMERGLFAYSKQRKERQRARTALRRNASSQSGSPRAGAGAGSLAAGGERNPLRPGFAAVAFRFCLMAVGGMTVASHIRRASQAVLHGHRRGKNHKHTHEQ